MENIKFEIKEQDIKEYLKLHKDDESIKYKEAMFVKYMKEQKILTKEAMEILMRKYNWEDRVISGTYHYDNLGLLKQESLPNFDSYLNNIKNLDLSGICHIMIPMLSYYNLNRDKYFDIFNELDTLIWKLQMKPVNLKYIEKDTYENYAIAYNNEVFRSDTGTNLYFSKEKSCKLIQSYASIYGEVDVKIIRKRFRERMI